jgi:hypothetical protein
MGNEGTVIPRFSRVPKFAGSPQEKKNTLIGLVNGHDHQHCSTTRIGIRAIARDVEETEGGGGGRSNCSSSQWFFFGGGGTTKKYFWKGESGKLFADFREKRGVSSAPFFLRHGWSNEWLASRLYTLNSGEKLSAAAMIVDLLEYRYKLTIVLQQVAEDSAILFGEAKLKIIA